MFPLGVRFPVITLQSLLRQTTKNYQVSKYISSVLSAFIWTPQCKIPYGWIHSSSSVLLLSWRKLHNSYNSTFTRDNHGWITPFLVNLLLNVISAAHSSQSEREVKLAWSCPTVCTPWTVRTVACSLSLDISRPEYWSGWLFPSPEGIPNPGIKPRSPTLQADSLPSDPPGKPQNTRVGSLSLLHQIFLSQESNWSLLHCRWILYQLN